MKRSRMESLPGTEAPSGTTAKVILRKKEQSSTKTVTALPPEKKPGQGRGSEEKSPADEEVAVPIPEAAVASPHDEGASGTWDMEASELGDWWWCGVEEERLLGWFPFADEHFLCSAGNRGVEGGGLLLAEEEEEVDYDIWGLQHIREIPSTAK